MKNPFETSPVPRQETVSATSDQWTQQITKESERYRTSFLINSEKFSTAALEAATPDGFQEWSPEAQRQHLEALGRFRAGLSMCSWMGMSQWTQRLGHEVMRVAGRNATHAHAETEALKTLGALFLALERNSNSTGSARKIFDGIAIQLIKILPDSAAAEQMLSNPFELEPGTELISYGSDAKQLVTQQVRDIAPGNLGIVELDHEHVDLKDLNERLATGTTMLKSGDNFFGTVEGLRIWSRVDAFKPGSSVSFLPPFAEHPEELTVVESNEEQLAQTYGNAWMPFYRHAPDLFKIRARLSDGKVTPPFDAGNLRLVET